MYIAAFDFYSDQERLLIEELAALNKTQNIPIPGEVPSFIPHVTVVYGWTFWAFLMPIFWFIQELQT